GCRTGKRHPADRRLLIGIIGGGLLFLFASQMVAEPGLFSGLSSAAIHFSYRPISFSLDSCETPQKHAPETMAGGVAVFDYDNDGYVDIFFTNGADIVSLKKTSPKFSDRLFHNNSDGTFTDVKSKAELTATWYKP